METVKSKLIMRGFLYLEIGIRGFDDGAMGLGNINKINVMEYLNNEEKLLLLRLVPIDMLVNIEDIYLADSDDISNENYKGGIGYLDSIRPEVLLKRLNDGDKKIIFGLNAYTTKFVQLVKEKIFNETNDRNFLKKSLMIGGDREFIKLIDIIAKLFYSDDDDGFKYVGLFFKLIGVELTDTQLEYIEDPQEVKEEFEKRDSLVEDIGKIDRAIRKIKIKDIGVSRDRDESLNRLEEEVKGMTMNYDSDINKIEEKVAKLLGDLKEIKSDKGRYEEELKTTIEEKEEEIKLIKEENSKLENIISEKARELENMRDGIEKESQERLDSVRSKWGNENKELRRLMSDRQKDYDALKAEKKELRIKYEEENKRLKELELERDEKYISLERENNRLRELKKQSEEDYMSLEAESKELSNKLSEYEDKFDGILENIDEETIGDVIKNSLMAAAGAESIQTPSVSYSPMSISNNDSPYIRENIVYEDITILEDIDELNIRAGRNLEAVGVHEEEAYFIANYMISIIASGLIPVISGFRTRKIGEALSRAYSGETPYIISLGNGKYNPHDLINICNDADTSVILIEDALNNMDTLLPLMREYTDGSFASKKILFSDEDIESIEYLPENILNYIALVRIVDYKLSSGKEMRNSNGIDVLRDFVASYDFSRLNEFSDGKGMFHRILEDINIRDIYRDIRSMILISSERASFGNELSNPQKHFEVFFKSEFIVLAKIQGITDELRKNIERYSLADELFYIIGEEFEYDFDDGIDAFDLYEDIEGELVEEPIEEEILEEVIEADQESLEEEDLGHDNLKEFKPLSDKVEEIEEVPEEELQEDTSIFETFDSGFDDDFGNYEAETELEDEDLNTFESFDNSFGSFDDGFDSEYESEEEEEDDFDAFDAFDAFNDSIG